MDLSTRRNTERDSGDFNINGSVSVKSEPHDYVENGTSLENEDADVHITSAKLKSSGKQSPLGNIEVKVEPLLPLVAKTAKKEKTTKPKPVAKAAKPKVVKQEKTLKQEGPENRLKQEKITDSFAPERKKRDRFHGLSEEEVLLRLLPDHLAHDLDIIIIGINPGLTAAYVGHHYAGPGNHFWKCLYLAGFIPEPMNAYDDYKLKDYGIGFTNIVARTTRGSADLTRKEIKEGADILTEKILKYNPKIAVFNGKGIYEVFCGNKNFNFGKQPERFPGTSCHVYVMPSSSARCTQLPRAIDKVPFYAGLRMLRDHLRGDLPDLDDSQVTFPDVELKVAPRKIKPEELDANGVKIETGNATKETAKPKIGTKREETPSDGSEKPKAKRGRKPKAKACELELQTLPETGSAFNSSELSMPSLEHQSIEDMPLGVPFPSDPNYLRKPSTQLEPLHCVKREITHEDYDDSVTSGGHRPAVTSAATAPSNLVSGWLQGFNGRRDSETVSPYFNHSAMLSSLQNNVGSQFGQFGGYNVPAHNGPFGGFNNTGNLANFSGAYSNTPNLSSMSNRLRSFSHASYPLIDDNYLFPSNPHAVFQAGPPTLVALTATDADTERYIQDISGGISQDAVGSSKPGVKSRQSL